MVKSHHDKEAKKRKKQQEREAQRNKALAAQRASTIKKSIIYGTVAIIVIAILWQIITNAQVSTEGLSELSLTEVSSLDNVKGQVDSENLLIEYSDFQCPACAAYQPVIKELVANNNVTFVYRHFPLRQIHPYADIAAQAAEAAGNQGKFFEMHDLIFENQDSWTVANPKGTFFEYAEQLSLNMEQFEADIESEEVKAKIQHMFDSAMDANVRSTPTFFLNGRKMSVTPSVEDFERRLR